MTNNYHIRTRDDFSLDGVSASSLGLAVEIPPVPPLATQQYTEYRYGGDTMGFAADNEFDPITITLQARVIKKPQEYDNTALYAFLQGKKILRMSRFGGYYYRIRRLLGITPRAKAQNNDITYQIQFVCDPWKHMDNTQEFPLPNDGVIANPGTRYSKPIIRMNVTGTPATVTTNGEVLTINTTGLITIDSDRMLVYKTVNNENTAITQYTQGKLPLFAVGTNLLQVSSNINSVTVVGNWRCY